MQLNTNSQAHTQKGEGSRYASPELTSSYDHIKQNATPHSTISPPAASQSKHSRFEGAGGLDGRGGHQAAGGQGGPQAVPSSKYSRQTSKTGERLPTEIHAQQMQMIQEGFRSDGFRTGNSNFKKTASRIRPGNNYTQGSKHEQDQRSNATSYSPDSKFNQDLKTMDEVKILDFAAAKPPYGGARDEPELRIQLKNQKPAFPEHAGLANNDGKYFPVNPDLMYGISKQPQHGIFSVLKAHKQQLEEDKRQQAQQVKVPGIHNQQPQKNQSSLPAVKSRNFNTQRNTMANQTSKEQAQHHREDSAKRRSMNLFNSGQTPSKKLNGQIYEMLTGERETNPLPLSPGNSKLLRGREDAPSVTNLDARAFNTLDDGGAKPKRPMFKEAPFWSNLNEESIISSQITSTARMHQHNRSTLPTDRGGMENFNTGRSLFQTRGNSIVAGNTQSFKQIHGGPSQFTNETLADTSRFNIHNRSNNRSSQKNNEITANTSRISDHEFQTIAVAGKRHKYDSIRQELDTIPDSHRGSTGDHNERVHMYDSVLLNQTAMKKSLRIKALHQSVSQLSPRTKAAIKQQTAKAGLSATQGSKADIHLPSLSPNKTQFNTLNTTNKQRARNQSMMQQDYDKITDLSSSAQSQAHILVINDREVETMHGRKISHLSPVTRNLNKAAKTTFKQLGNYEKKLKIKEEMKNSILLRMQQKLNEGNNVKPRDMLKKNSETIKQFKNELKQIVATDAEKFHILSSNNPNFTFMDVLPDWKPVYIKMACGGLFSPANFDIMLGNVDQLQVLLSTEHKFPSKDDQRFERERLLVKEVKKKEVTEDENGRQNSASISNANTSMVTTFFEQRNSINEKKFTISFMKSGQYHSTQFEDHEIIYIALLSNTGGTIRIRAEFNKNKESHQALKTAADVGGASKWWENSQNTPEAVIESLDKWFKENIKYSKAFQSQGTNFLEANKNERLAKYFRDNMQIDHLNKMFENQARRQQAYDKVKQLEEDKWERDRANIEKWEVYRDQKIELTAIFIRVLKKKNFLRRWLRLQKAGEIYAKVRENLLLRREMNRIMVNTYFVAIKFKSSYRYRYRKQYGMDMEVRTKNEARRALNFGAMAMFPNLDLQQKRYFTRFIQNMDKVFETCRQFTYFNTNVLFIQQGRAKIMETRELKNQLMWNRLEEQKDFFLLHYRTNKAAKKGKNAKPLLKNLKKIFDPKRPQDTRSIKKQIELLGQRNILDCQNLFLAIKVRTAVITYQLLAKSKKKDEFEAKVEELKEQTSKMLKKCKSNTKKIEDLDGALYGISDKEIKELAKYAKARRPEPATLAKYELYKHCKVDSAQVVKVDKTVKPAKAAFLKNGKKKKLPKAKTDLNSTMVSDLATTLTDGDDLGADFGGDGDGINLDATINDGLGMDGEEDGMDPDQDKDDMEGDGDQAEGEEQKDEEGGDNEEEQDKEDGGDGGDAADGKVDDQSADAPAAKKKKAASKSRQKTKSVKDENEIEMITWKASAKVSGRLVVGEPIKTPEDIAEFIASSTEQWEDGLDDMTADEISDTVNRIFRIPNKRRLMIYYEQLKMKPNITRWHKILVHLALNIGPQPGINEDIIEEIKEEPQVEDGELADLNVKALMTELPEKQADKLDAEADGAGKELALDALALPERPAMTEIAGGKERAGSARSRGGSKAGARKLTKEKSSRAVDEAQEPDAKQAAAKVLTATQHAFGKAVPATPPDEERSQKSQQSKKSQQSQSQQQARPQAADAQQDQPASIEEAANGQEMPEKVMLDGAEGAAQEKE